MYLSRISWNKFLLNLFYVVVYFIGVKMIRRPAVAGSFYPATRDSLLSYISRLFSSSRGPGSEPEVILDGSKRLLGIVSPHAGYMYSGEIAAHGYFHYAGDGLRDTVILIGPNHTGLGSAISIYPGGSWETPLGSVDIDEEFIDDLSNVEPFLAKDDAAHIYEHSLEVQVPFLQYLYLKAGTSFKIVPIVMMYQTLEGVKVLGDALYKVIVRRGVDKFFIIASSDFSHYLAASKAKELDGIAIDKILQLDPEGLISSVYKWDISMCGYGPVATLLYIARKLGGYKAKLLKYGNSGEVTNDFASVVAYASIMIERS